MDGSKLNPGELKVKPSSARLICETSTLGAAVTCGRGALNCSHRRPRAERMSALESSAPRFCFNPRLIASCSERGKTHGTRLAGLLPENGLTPRVPGIAWPRVEGVSPCAKQDHAHQSMASVRRRT